MEILDVFKNLNSQVVGLQNKQVQQFSESLKPKNQRDLGTEVNVDKAVENINRTLEAKLGALEFVVQNINPQNRGGDQDLATAVNRNTFYNSLSQVNNSGDVIPLWNSIVRSYQVQGISRETQQVLKVKVQELSPNLEAINYGLNQAIDTIFEYRIMRPQFAVVIFNLLRTLSVYNEIKNQVDSNPPRFEILSVELLDRAFRNIFESQSAERLTVLKQYAPRGELVPSSIRNIPDFKTGDVESRVRAIEEELGVQIPPAERVGVVNAFSKMSGVKLDNAINELKHYHIPAHKHTLQKENAYIYGALQDLLKAEQDVAQDIAEAQQSIQLSRQTITDLEEGVIISDEEAQRQLIPLPELPIEPERPNLFDYFDPMTGGVDAEQYEGRMEHFNEIHDEWFGGYLEYRRIEDHNRNIYLQAIQDQTERQEAIIELKRQEREMRNHLGELIDAQYELERENADKRARFQAEKGDIKIDRLDAIFRKLLLNQAQKLKGSDAPEGKEEDEKEPPSVPAKRGRKKKEILPPPPPSAPVQQYVAPEIAHLLPDYAELEGIGKPVDRRGMSSLKGGYGYQDIQVQKKKQMHFDDRGNDNYYTKPVM
jgi:hypothetical protein